MLQKELIQLGLDEKEQNQLFKLWEILSKFLKSDEEVRTENNFIQDGFDPEIDKLRKIAYHSDELLLEYQQFLVSATGITNVKLKYIMNQGYFIEVTNKDIEPLEQKIKEFHNIEGEEDAQKLFLSRRQTLKGNQRYMSPYLEHIQEAIISSKDQLAKLEFQLLGTMVKHIAEITGTLSHLAQIIAELDVY